MSPDQDQPFFHDLLNLLALISHGSELALMRGGRDPDRLLGVIEQNLAAVRSAIDLVAAQKGLCPDSGTDLRELILRTARLISTNPDRPARVSIPPVVVQDPKGPSDLMRVLLNLALNAAQATRSEGAVEIRLMPVPETPNELTFGSPPDGPSVQIRVSDTGVGVPKDLQDLIWAEGFTTRGADGSGSGLPLVRRLVETAGAGLLFRSKAAAGTTVDLWWPISS